MKDKDWFIEKIQYYGCWSPGYAWIQGISSHGNYLVSMKYSHFSTRRVSLTHELIKNTFSNSSPSHYMSCKCCHTIRDNYVFSLQVITTRNHFIQFLVCYILSKNKPIYTTISNFVIEWCITMTSKWVQWCLKSPALGLFTQPFIHVQIRENIMSIMESQITGKSDLSFNSFFWLITAQIARFMGPTWGPPESCRPQVGRKLAPWTLLSGKEHIRVVHHWPFRKGIHWWSVDSPHKSQ